MKRWLMILWFVAFVILVAVNGYCVIAPDQTIASRSGHGFLIALLSWQGWGLLEVYHRRKYEDS